MIRINLLPHRAEKRKQRRTQFYALSAAMIVLGALIGILVHSVYAGYIERQASRNAFLKAEIAKLDQQIAEIRRLREQIDALLARKKVIEDLQSTRAESVHLLNELAKGMPDGVYLKSVKQAGSRITLVGHAQSNARVSHLMRNLEDSPFLERPTLVEAKAVTVDDRRLSEFTLGIGIERTAVEEPAADAKGGKTQARGARK
ncbi:PilN domain-containing protein [Thauera linaloolentis]|uniref:Type IV fimbrial biogenesis protein PilN n=1 Tax=Thauera linaloolentis (strain DSM 12138 / JCM 21573 / CCUG 41526 / CIP 105981 / IAM 15112 / NBRC 102519 / 47Lol) TaxID=1123367 RepID=N6YAE7_THAL4|nr:PilN domain-containing protein [Thauera linaloolentis]ENO88485.1 type IV fimbrial biogenesis protein PilN [Thauera linaloolentis 47Lol = DSM 12138]MCM8567447.1 PilN domain-containing protein [Thauera linaloolentis]